VHVLCVDVYAVLQHKPAHVRSAFHLEMENR